MSEIGKCKECGAEITRSTTFCRSCNSVFPEFVEISQDTSTSDEDKKTEEKNSSVSSGLSYSSIGSSQEKEIEKPETSTTSESEPKSDSGQEDSTDDLEPQSVPHVEHEPKVESEPHPEPSEPELTHHKEAEQPVQKTDRPLKSTSGESSVFQRPKLPPSSSGIKLRESDKKFFSSAKVIAEIASETGRSPEEVAGVVDGFWDYVADVRLHFKEGVKRHVLSIPHFGTFRFQFKWKKGSFHPKLTFKSSTTLSARAHRRTYSSKWADQWAGDPKGLSVRRKISVYISERCGLPLRQADQVFNRLLRTTRELCEGGGRIHWARRGTMGTFRVEDKKEGSAISILTRERITRRTGRNSITGERIPAEGNEHFSFSASKGFLKRLNVPDPPEEARVRWSGFSSPTGRQKKNSGCNGCLAIFAVIVLLFLGWVAFMAIEAYEETAYEPNTSDTVTEKGFETTLILEAIPAKDVNPLLMNSSSSDTTKTIVLFSNLLDYPVVVHWIDFNGKREKFVDLRPGRWERLSTYSGHVWLITDRQGEALTYFIADKVRKGGQGLAEITPRNIPAK